MWSVIFFTPRDIFSRKILCYIRQEMKVCICFFGVVSRSIQHTIYSIKRNVLNELRRYGHSYDIYVHDIKVRDFQSNRAGDSCSQLSYKSKLLPATFYESSNQTEMDQHVKVQSKKLCPFGCNPDFDAFTVLNCFRQLYSIARVTKMWKTHGRKYDYFIYLRPDLKYETKLPVKLIEKNYRKNILLSPNWHRHGGYNDRIYMGPENIISRLGLRLNDVYSILSQEKKPYHPERFIGYVVKKYKIKARFVDFYGRRVRSNGQISTADPPINLFTGKKMNVFYK